MKSVSLIFRFPYPYSIMDMISRSRGEIPYFTMN